MGAVSETSRPLFERGLFRPGLRFCACRLPATARRTAGAALTLSGWLAGWTGGVNSSGIADRSSEVRRGSGYSGQKERGLNENSSAGAAVQPVAVERRQRSRPLPLSAQPRTGSSSGRCTSAPAHLSPILTSIAQLLTSVSAAAPTNYSSTGSRPFAASD